MDKLYHRQEERERVTMEDGNGDIKFERQPHREDYKCWDGTQEENAERRQTFRVSESPG